MSFTTTPDLLLLLFLALIALYGGWHQIKSDIGPWLSSRRGTDR